MTRRLTILIVPLDGIGHINYCHGIAEVLRNRGHRIIFAMFKGFAGRLAKYGFEEEVTEIKNSQNGDLESNEDFWADYFKNNSVAFKSTALVAVEKFMINGFPLMHLRNKELDDVYQNIVEKSKPDIIMVDMYCGSPTLTNSGIPWVWILSAGPHFIFNSEKIPPYWSGLPLNDKTSWNDFTYKRNEVEASLRNNINQFYLSKGLPELPNNRLHPESPFLNIYLSPKELDYAELMPIPSNYIGIDAAVRTTNDEFSIPEKLQLLPGKLVYLTMGSIASADLELMTRLVGILSKSPNRFIVSKGLLHDKYELPDNMWGQKFVPQTKILSLVDLVIHHGGNNTLTETFYFGKPMIIMPIFGDQLDIAQRVAEIGFGLRLNPYHCTEQNLLESVEYILNNEQLNGKMRLIGERIRSSNSIERAAELIEKLAY